MFDWNVGPNLTEVCHRSCAVKVGIQAPFRVSAASWSQISILCWKSLICIRYKGESDWSGDPGVWFRQWSSSYSLPGSKKSTITCSFDHFGTVLGQLCHNYETNLTQLWGKTWGQLGDNVETTLRQPWDNLRKLGDNLWKTWRHLWGNFETTLRHFETSWRRLWDNLETTWG